METRFAQLDAAAWALPEAVVARTQTPALVVYLPRVRENVRRVLDLAGGPERWRPHVKTTKIPAVFAELVRAGLHRFKCATTREARYLLETLRAEGMAGDVLLAHPLRGPGLDRLGELAGEHPGARLAVLCEDADLISEIPAALGIFVDVNSGMHRTGLPLEAREEILAVARAAGPRFRGVHFYDGHLHAADLSERRRAVFAGYDALGGLLEELAGVGADVGEVVTSGTPALTHALAYRGFPEGTVHRISPGTVVYHDLRTEQENPDLDLQPAALVLTRVVSHPNATTATCDAGSKSIAAEAGDPCAHVLGHPELVARTPSEEHLPLRVDSGERPARGTALLLVPRHVCPTVNLAEEALLVDGADIRRVPVSARAHEL